MLGRGMVCDPGLALAIRAGALARSGEAGLAWDDLQPLVAEFWRLVSRHIEPRARAGRLKQWLNYLRRRHPQAEAAYAAVRTINDPAVVLQVLRATWQLPESRAASGWRTPTNELEEAL